MSVLDGVRSADRAQIYSGCWRPRAEALSQARTLRLGMQGLGCMPRCASLPWRCGVLRSGHTRHHGRELCICSPQCLAARRQLRQHHALVVVVLLELHGLNCVVMKQRLHRLNKGISEMPSQSPWAVTFSTWNCSAFVPNVVEPWWVHLST